MFSMGTTVDVDKHQGKTEEEAVHETPEAAIHEDIEPEAYMDPTPAVSCNYLCNAT